MRSETVRAALLCLLPPTLAACGATRTEGDQSISGMITQAEYAGALRSAYERHASEGSAESEEEYRQATVAFLLDRGRRETLGGRDEAALETFAEALNIAPESDQARQWLRKTRDKLARRWFEEAREKHADDDLPGALEAYELALLYDPEHGDASAGIVRVGRQLEYRDELSVDFYNEGLAALRNVQLQLAKSRFAYSSHYRHWDEKPVRRVSEVNVEIAREMVGVAAGLETDGYYAAARTEYRLARALDRQNAEAADGYERMLVEAEADDLLERGEMWLLRGEWAKADEVLRQGRALTAVQHDRFDAVLAGIDEARIAARYEQALNLERDFRYEEAAATFRAILDERGFYQDSRARLDTLEATIAEVETLYSRLPGVAGDPEAERALLREIEAKWPEYRDVRDRLDR